jgi:hypothetical protein
MFSDKIRYHMDGNFGGELSLAVCLSDHQILKNPPKFPALEETNPRACTKEKF